MPIGSKPNTITVRRFGGMLPALNVSKTHAIDALDTATRSALIEFVSGKTPLLKAVHPEGMSYQFELTTEEGIHKVSAPFSDIPDALRLLLPNPSDRR